MGPFVFLAERGMGFRTLFEPSSDVVAFGGAKRPSSVSKIWIRGFKSRSCSGCPHQEQREPYADREVAAVPENKAKTPVFIIMGNIDHQ
jgi:hypothetical protein